MRERALAAAHDRYNWAAQAVTLLALYAGMTERAAILPASRSTVEGA